MATASAHRALPVPEGSDVPDVPLYLGALADALDFDLFVVETMPRPAFGTLGRVHRDTGTGALSFDTGAAWLTLPTGGPFLAIAGGALTGALDLTGHELDGIVLVEDLAKVTTVAAAGANRGVDAAVSPIHDVTLDQNVTFGLSGVDGDRLVLIVRQPGAVKTVTWPATVDWDTGVAPIQVASTVRVYRFVRVAGRWVGTPGGPTDRALGVLDRAVQTANPGLVTAATDVPGMQVAATPAAADRELEVAFDLSVLTNVQNDSVQVDLLVNGAVVQSWHVCPAVAGIADSRSYWYSYEPAVALQTIKVRISRLSGTGAVNTVMTSNRTGRITVKDAGVGQN